MNFKKWKIFSPIIIFILSFLVHFVYDLMPNIITSIFFPVNESIFEHMKMIYTTILIFSLIEYIILKKKDIILNNLGINPFISGITNIISFLLIYLPVRYIIGEKMIITFIILFISNVITSYVSYKVLLHKQMINNKLGLLITFLVYIPMIYLTYNPPHNFFFYDPSKELYGIPK